MNTQTGQASWRAEASRNEDACLPLLIPANADRFKVEDPVTARILADLGADLVSDRIDVEMVDVADVGGKAAHAITRFDADVTRRDEQGRAERAARRIVGHAQLRMRTRTASRALARKGYRTTGVLMWDKGKGIRLQGSESVQRTGSLVERLPQRALVRGSRERPSRSLYGAALSKADEATPEPLRPECVLARSGLLVTLTSNEVLRVALGPARHRIAPQVDVLRALQSPGTPSKVRRLVPTIIDAGWSGLVYYSLEARMPGTTTRVMEQQVTKDALNFLVALHAAPITSKAAPRPTSAAITVGRHVTADEGHALACLARDTEGILRNLPRGVAHGDFFPGNLLVDDGRLVGVIDWDTARAGQYPLLDLIHLTLHIKERSAGSPGWGPALVSRMLPWARRGGDPLVHAYCQQLGIRPSPQELHALVVAYWLSRLDYQLSMYANRSERHVWLANNVTGVLRALLASHPELS